jgi:hypothetical protein
VAPLLGPEGSNPSASSIPRSMKITLGKLRSMLKEVLSDEPSKRDQLISIYSDTYKEKHGIRPRWKHAEFEKMSDDEIEAELNDLYDEPGDTWDADEDLANPAEPQPHEPGFYPEPEGTVDPDEPGDPYEKMPMRMGMARDEDSVGYEKRHGEFAGDAGRKAMKVSRGR